MEKLRFCLIGVGRAGMVHANNIVFNIPGAELVAIVDPNEKQRESLMFLTNEMVANVARAHSKVEDQEALSAWMERLQLHDPADFLPRLALVLGAIVPVDEWWFDRDALRDKLPE